MYQNAVRICCCAVVVGLSLVAPAQGKSVVGAHLRQIAAPVEVQAEKIADTSDSAALQHAEVMVRAMSKGYEFYLERGNLTKANDYLVSLVNYIQYQSSLFGMSPEALAVAARIGTAATWDLLQRQAQELQASPRSARPDDSERATNCMALGDKTCASSR